MPLKPGPVKVIHGFHSSEEVLDDIKKLDLWPTVYVSENGRAAHWHDVDMRIYHGREQLYLGFQRFANRSFCR